VFKKRSVLTIALLALVLSMLTFTAYADEQPVQTDGWVFEGNDASFLRDSVKVTGIVEVDFPADWWPESWGGEAKAPKTAYYYFDEHGVVVRNFSWQKIDDVYYYFTGINTLHTGWLWSPVRDDNYEIIMEGGEPKYPGTMHYMLPEPAEGITLTTNIPASWSYDEERVTHRWFIFGGEKGELEQEKEDWEDGFYWFGHGVTLGWVFVAEAGGKFEGNNTDGNLVHFDARYDDAAGKLVPVQSRGGNNLIFNPWTNDVRRFAFDRNGNLENDLWVDAAVSTHFRSVVDGFLPGITFIILEERSGSVFGDGANQAAFRLILDDGKEGVVLRENALHEQPGGGWRIAVAGDFEASNISLEIFR